MNFWRKKNKSSDIQYTSNPLNGSTKHVYDVNEDLRNVLSAHYSDYSSQDDISSHNHDPKSYIGRKPKPYEIPKKVEPNDKLDFRKRLNQIVMLQIQEMKNLIRMNIEKLIAHPRLTKEDKTKFNEAKIQIEKELTKTLQISCKKTAYNSECVAKVFKEYSAKLEKLERDISHKLKNQGGKLKSLRKFKTKKNKRKTCRKKKITI